MSYYKHCRVVASYRTMCFCERVPLPEGPKVSSEGRVERKAMLERYASALGLTVEGYRTLDSGSGASATMVMPAPCAHRTEQIVRLEVVPCV